jgi:hypothetical protein
VPHVGVEVGCLPLLKENAFKYWGQVKFRNTTEHPVMKIPISMPPTEPDYNMWDVPPTLKEDVRWAPKSLLGNKEFGRGLEEFRICWSVLCYLASDMNDARTGLVTGY